VRNGGTGPAVIYVPGAGASPVSAVHLAQRLPQENAFHILQPRGYERRGLPEVGTSRIVRRRVRMLRRLRPHGPYVVVGHSLGALHALEIARRLEAEGEEVVAGVLDPFWSASRLGVERGIAPTVTQVLLPELIGRSAAVPPRWQLLQRRARRALSLPLAGILPMPPERRERLLFTLGWLDGRRARPEPWHGRAISYRTADNHDPDELWSMLLPNPVVDTRVPCEHNSVLRPPYVERLAADVRAALADLGSRGEPVTAGNLP
jgi:thioesterase domain-containing protein